MTGVDSNIDNPFYDDSQIIYVLYVCAGFKKNLTFLSFSSCEGAVSSDHKPVHCDFLLETTDGGAAIVDSGEGAGIEMEMFDMKGSGLASMDFILGQEGEGCGRTSRHMTRGTRSWPLIGRVDAFLSLFYISLLSFQCCPSHRPSSASSLLFHRLKLSITSVLRLTFDNVFLIILHSFLPPSPFPLTSWI